MHGFCEFREFVIFISASDKDYVIRHGATRRRAVFNRLSPGTDGMYEDGRTDGLKGRRQQPGCVDATVALVCRSWPTGRHGTALAVVCRSVFCVEWDAARRTEAAGVDGDRCRVLLTQGRRRLHRMNLGTDAASYDNWQLSLLSTHLQPESWIAEYIQWPKYENMQKCPKREII